MHFDELMYEKIKKSIEGWHEDICKDIYAISFFIYDDDDDPRMPTLTLGYNTNEQWKKTIPDASSEMEAKWNYAFWLQNEEVVVGDEGDESIREQWIKKMGLWYSDEEQDDDFDRTLEIDEAITQKFVELAVSVSSKLHSERVIENNFGRHLPIIIHELEYYDEISRQTERANPSGLVSEFVDWVDKEG